MNRRKNISFAMIFVSLVCIVLGTPILAMFALNARYVLMCIMIPIVAHGFYGFPFYLVSYRNNKMFIRLDALINSGISDADTLREEAGLTKKGLDYFLSKMEKKGYLLNFAINE